MQVFLAGEVALQKDQGVFKDVEGWQTGSLASIIKRRLYSYFYHPKIDSEVQIAIDNNIDLFLDSGAFSAHTVGKPVSLDDYARFIQENGHHFRVKANLDDIGDTGPKSWENWQELRRQGCDVFPVHHAADQDKYLEMILEVLMQEKPDGTSFMALGGLVGAGREVLRTWLDYIWSKFLTNEDGTAKLRVHGFGLTDTELMFRYPWYSVDSSSWIMTGIFGGCIFYDGKRFVKVVFSDESPDRYKIDGWHYSTMTAEQQRSVDALLEPMGVTAEQCAKHYSFRHLVNAQTFTNIEDMATPRTFFLQQGTMGLW